MDFPTQKPEALAKRIVEACTRPNDLVVDFFCGSGTTLAVAEKLGRRWIGCDLGRWAIHVTRKRLLGIENCKPFEVLNLGKYERQYWQGVTFGEAKDKPFTEQAAAPKEVSMGELREIVVYAKVGGKWRAVSNHLSRLPSGD